MATIIVPTAPMRALSSPNASNLTDNLTQSQHSSQAIQTTNKSEPNEEANSSQTPRSQAAPPEDPYNLETSEEEADLEDVSIRSEEVKRSLDHLKAMGKAITARYLAVLKSPVVEQRFKPDPTVHDKVQHICSVSQSLVLRLVWLHEAETKITAMSEYKDQLSFETMQLLKPLAILCNMKIRDTQQVFYIFAFAAPHVAKLTYLAIRYCNSEGKRNPCDPPAISPAKLITILNDFHNLLDSSMRKREFDPAGWKFLEPVTNLMESVVRLKKTLAVLHTPAKATDWANLQATASQALNLAQEFTPSRSRGTTGRQDLNGSVDTAEGQAPHTSRKHNELKRISKDQVEKSRRGVEPSSARARVGEGKGKQKTSESNRPTKKPWVPSRTFTSDELERLSTALGKYHANWEAIQRHCPTVELHDIKGCAERVALNPVSGVKTPAWVKPVLKSLGHDV